LTKIIYVAPIHIGQIIKNQSKIIFWKTDLLALKHKFRREY
jgi:hypothetical protein